MSTAKSTQSFAVKPGTSGFVPDARNDEQGRIRLATNQEAALGVVENVAVDPKQARGIVPAITLTDNEDGTATFSIQGTDADGESVAKQVADADGESVAKQVAVEVWIDDSEGGVPSDLGTLAVTTGALLTSHTADAHVLLLSDANGLIEGTFDRTADGDLAFHAIVQPSLVTETVSVTGN